MASRKKKTEEIVTSTGDVKEINTEKTTAPAEKTQPKTKKPKFEVGSIVYVNKSTNADLNGFNLSISRFKKDAYTVEDYDANTGVYSVRHLKLLLQLKEDDLVAPDANAHDMINRKQF